MIKSFGDKETEKNFNGKISKKVDSTIQRKAFGSIINAWFLPTYENTNGYSVFIS